MGICFCMYYRCCLYYFCVSVLLHIASLTHACLAWPGLNYSTGQLFLYLRFAHILQYLSINTDPFWKTTGWLCKWCCLLLGNIGKFVAFWHLCCFALLSLVWLCLAWLGFALCCFALIAYRLLYMHICSHALCVFMFKHFNATMHCHTCTHI